MGSLDGFRDNVIKEETKNRNNPTTTGNFFTDFWNDLTGRTETNVGWAQFEYQKKLQERIFGREDNAIQRRALDMEAAGLSKTLAAGGGANAGAVINPSGLDTVASGARSKRDFLGKALRTPQALLGLKQQRESIEQTKAQNALLNQQTNKAKEEINFMKENNPERLQQQRIKTFIAKASQNSQVQKIAAQVAQIVGATAATKSSVQNMDARTAAQYIVNEVSRYNADWYIDYGIPTDMTLSGPAQTAAILHGLAKKLEADLARKSGNVMIYEHDSGSQTTGQSHNSSPNQTGKSH